VGLGGCVLGAVMEVIVRLEYEFVGIKYVLFCEGG